MKSPSVRCTDGPELQVTRQLTILPVIHIMHVPLVQP